MATAHHLFPSVSQLSLLPTLFYSLEHFHLGWVRLAHSQKNGPAPREVSPAHGITWHPAQAGLLASLKLTDLGTFDGKSEKNAPTASLHQHKGFQHDLYVRNHKNRIENLPR
ncbi:cadmium/zinc-transporting ATPase HMA1 [Pyrus ussuriensis x Pyrus communis]|uniref:Cadmium/zinc-transporting ATPase HMA1 n=1 Tax=Pyrus ussuriensis x Pyrus communis TaxID=2448454 RepID=A0A5N5F223_9ROSA|nr:cadmium/zinc-transporting ATPase HMA1 [Pyrus ussuriensis x Pyrus communis]